MHDEDEQPWGQNVEARVSGFLIPFESFPLPSLSVFGNLQTKYFLTFIQTFSWKVLGLGSLNTPYWVGSQMNPPGFNFFYLLWHSFSLASSGMALRQDKFQNNQVSYTKTKPITRCRQSNEPMRTRSKYMWPVPSVEKTTFKGETKFGCHCSIRS